MLAIREFVQQAEEEKKQNPDFFIEMRHFNQALGIEGIEEESAKEFEKELKDF